MYAVAGTFRADPLSIDRSAAAIEMIHTFSLIHDDLPAMDNDDLRRGRMTCHKKYGDATAILAGDVLQTLAFKALSVDNGLPPDTRVRLISIIADASGTPNGMVAGQQLDLEAEGRVVELTEIEGIHERKTGALIKASAIVGAVIAGADEWELAAVDRYSDRLGLLFQITDDIIDVTQTTEMIGKTAGKDVNAQKATYPGLLGIERSRELASLVCAEACAELGEIDHDTKMLASIALKILDRTK
jgi:geranylgeranyl pyrophosphate synthase